MSDRTVIPLGLNPFAPATIIADQVKRPIVRKGIRGHYADLLAELAESQPDVIRHIANAQDMQDRAAHITAVGRAFAAYVEEFIDDTAHKMNAGSLDRDAHFQILDTIGDVAGQMTRIGEDLAEGSDW